MADFDPTAPETTADDFTKRAVCLRLTITRFGDKRQVATEQVQCDTNKSRLSISKKILSHRTFDAIRSCDFALKRDLNKLTLPSLFKAGIFLVPIAQIEAVDALLLKYQAERAELVQAFLAIYPDLVLEQRPELRAIYNATDYPAVSTVAQAFNVDFSYFTFAAPEALHSIKADIFIREQQRAREWWGAAQATAQDALRVGLGELVDHLVDRLGSEDGKPKVLRETTVTSLWDFLDNFSGRNIADDAQLQAVVSDAQRILSGIDVKKLRTDLDIRQQVLDGFKGIKTQVDALLVDRPERRIQLDEEPEPEAAEATPALAAPVEEVATA